MRLARTAVVVGLLLCAVPAGLGGREPSATPEQRAEALLRRMTLAEKLTMMHGGAECGYIGCVDGNPRLGIPALHLQDGPAGVGNDTTGVTQLPAPVAAAAAWDPALLHEYGRVIGAEQWGKGTNVALAPTVNIVRDPRWGRAFESLGEDPYLAGRAAAAELGGIRAEGPMAQVKHFAVYNQETARNTMGSDARIDERTLREIYLPAFEASIAAGVDSVMCGYNPVNGAYACENGDLLHRILRDELGFTGFVTSDWGGTHSTLPAVANGLDMEMPDSRYFGAPLTVAAEAGLADVDEHVRRILTAMIRKGLFDRKQTGDLTAVVTNEAHAAVARRVAEQGSVLLKNDGALLPAGPGVRSIAVLGSGGGASVLSQGGGSARVNPPYVVSPYQGIKERAGAGAEVTYQPGTVRADGALPPVEAEVLGAGLRAEFFRGTTLSGPPVATRTDAALDAEWRAGNAGIGIKENWSARWTGTLTPPATGTYTFSLTSSDGGRLRIGGRTVVDNGWAEAGRRTRTGTVTLTAGRPVPVEIEYAQFTGNAVLALGWTRPGQRLHDDAVAAAARTDLAVVVVGKFGTEGADLRDISLSADQDRLVRDVAAVNRNTVVVVNTGSAVAMPWAGSVRAVIQAWYPGQEYGHALAALLFGDVDFSGKLPVTFPRTLADVPAAAPRRWPGGEYSEGLRVGYRWYDAQGVTPLFPFGHGLSYTTFAYADLSVGAPRPDGSVPVSYTITNTGGRAGAETAQVYVGQPAATGEPPNNLRGFDRVTLAPGQSRRITTTLDARSFQHWDGGWVTAGGAYRISVGSSSRDLRLTGQVSLPPNPVAGVTSGR
ncbi:glycoside hydrolase family 3 C-terminal domain-containing protein [Actinoplanes sp. NPDC049316]|uniref:glycoside hydrolase family 3 C-terminal domain-containing protein n=1 Tax=Actinoplanes sp. NPDC049316 TaxID=3154727 RepID=UPI00341E6FED